MKTWFALMCGIALAALAGCGSSSSPGGEPPEPGLLSPISGDAALEASLKQALTAMASQEQIAVLDAATSAIAGDSNFTGTYTQELDVDELDAVRYDGSHLYVAPRRYFHCCFVMTDAGAPGDDPRPEPEASIRILATDPANGTARVESRIPLEPGTSVQGMYIEGDRLFALTGNATYGNFGMLWADIAIWAPEKLGFALYDVSDTTSPRLALEAELDGVFVESRRIGDTVYIVSRYTPRIDGLHYYVQTAEQQAENEALLAATTLDELLPKITIGDQTRSLVDPERCYVSTAESQPYAVITSITAVPLDNPDAFSTTCYNESTYGVYVSADAMYFTELRSNDNSGSSITRVHKFALAGTNVSYRGSADIIGTVWRGGHADFRMSEHAGDLRLLATQFDQGSEDFVDHQLYILRESPTASALDIVSALPNDDRPDEIGKPNEDLYGVRFLGDVAYAVTFERIDPLYAIDLSDPSDPFIAGELEVTGFSDLLHPVNDDLLLGVGRSADRAIKLELFDVSTISQPLSRGSIVVGGPGSYSEALYDRHAFTYQSDVEGVDRFTIPAHVYAPDVSLEYTGSALYLFEIRDKDTPAQATLIDSGSIAPPSPDPSVSPWVERSRAFIHDDTVYYIRDEDVWAAFWHTPSLANGPY